jgi:mannan endo-1,4-beta-mannosidase
MFTSTYALAALFSFAASQTVTYQAEDAALSGTTVGTSVAGYTGKDLPRILSTSIEVS